MIATTKFAENRIVELLRRYGKDTVLGAVHEMMDRTEKAVRAEIAAMPDGTYSGESSTDDDGTILDEPVTVRVDVTIKGDEVTARLLPQRRPASRLRQLRLRRHLRAGGGRRDHLYRSRTGGLPQHRLACARSR